MRNAFEQSDVDEAEDLDLMEVKVGERRVSWAGITRPGGDVYLQGDLHPLGSATALIKAAKDHVPYVAVSAVQVLYPSEWLRAECLHDMDRLRVIGQLESFVRGQ